MGIDVTQATLSRDLNTLGVVKGRDGYAVAGAAERGEQNNDQLWKVVRQELVDGSAGGTTVVLRTRPGHANALAHEIDQTPLPEVLGTIAGDDTIFIATKSDRHAKALFKQFATRGGLR